MGTCKVEKINILTVEGEGVAVQGYADVHLTGI